jgi:hypothetical protein
MGLERHYRTEASPTKAPEIREGRSPGFRWFLEVFDEIIGRSNQTADQRLLSLPLPATQSSPRDINQGQNG